ncbi:hypothetical protein LXA43DRAFT_1101921 [Ganoderma leucocontextum]|nr:hypothetical protein LXA43DRAFT_1101921 [Ganoderma leucocontextum]
MPSRARSATPHPALKTTADAGLRASSVGHFKVSGGIPPSASHAPTLAPPIWPEDFYPPPDLPPPSGRITQSASTARASLSGIKAPSLSSDLSVTGVTLPEPRDPNDYVHFKKSYFSEHAKIEYGDIFWYRSPYGVQMWL